MNHNDQDGGATEPPISMRALRAGSVAGPVHVVPGRIAKPRRPVPVQADAGFPHLFEFSAPGCELCTACGTVRFIKDGVWMYRAEGRMPNRVVPVCQGTCFSSGSLVSPGQSFMGETGPRLSPRGQLLVNEQSAGS